MRLALVSDIHGNTIALDAVIADAGSMESAVDEWWALGDLAAIGPEPAGVLERLSALPGLRVARGNTDRYAVGPDRPPPSHADAMADPELWPLVVQVAESFAWTNGHLEASGWHEWLAALPLELRTVLPDGSRLLGVHASPGRDDGRGVSPSTPDEDVRQLVAGCDAEVVCVGHTHRPVDRLIDGVRVINLGSLSNPVGPDLRASYVIVDADEVEVRIEHRRVEYDHEAFIDRVRRSHHPAADYIISHQKGEKL